MSAHLSQHLRNRRMKAKYWIFLWHWYLVLDSRMIYLTTDVLKQILELQPLPTPPEEIPRRTVPGWGDPATSRESWRSHQGSWRKTSAWWPWYSCCGSRAHWGRRSCIFHFHYWVWKQRCERILGRLDSSKFCFHHHQSCPQSAGQASECRSSLFCDTEATC